MPWSNLSPERVAELYAEARRLHVLFDNLPALIAYWDTDLRNVIANDAYIDFFGLSPQQMRGMHVREVFGEELYALNLPFMEAALAGQEQQFERSLVDVAGNLRHTQASFIPDTVDGVVEGVYVMVTDVTARVEARLAMDEAQAIAGVGSWSVDSAGTVSWTDQLYRVLGLDPETTAPSVPRFLEMIHPDDYEQAIATAGDRAVEYESEYRIIRPDGSVRDLVIHSRPRLAPDGTLLGTTGTVQDVTERNRGARELAAINGKLAAVNRLNADVIGMLGHDVRQPVTVILGYMDELAESWQDLSPDEIGQWLLAGRRAATRLSALVDNILAMASVDSQALTARPSTVDLGALAEEVVADLVRGETIEVSVAPGLVAFADPFHLRQILANLISNAIRHGRPPYVVTAAQQDGRSSISITDHGDGVPPEFVPHLFERFRRIENHGSAKRPGSGFGLHLVEQLTHANGGTVEYTPAPGGGSRFTVTLPASSG